LNYISGGFDLGSDEAAATMGTASQVDVRAAQAAERRANRMHNRQAVLEQRRAAASAVLEVIDESVSDQQLLSNLAEQLGSKKTTLKKAFRDYDKGYTGTITQSDFVAALQQLGLDVPPERIMSLISKFDVDGSGSLHYYEWARMISSINDAEDEHADMAAATAGGAGPLGASNPLPPPPTMSTKSSALTEDDMAVLSSFRNVLSEERIRMRACFKAFDTAGDKTVSAAEFEQGLATMGVSVTAEEATRLCNRFGKDGRVR